MDSLARESVLAGAQLEQPLFSVRENTDVGLIRLQTFHRKSGAVEGLSQRLGMLLPGPGEVTAEQGMRLFWSAPGEWIIAVPMGSEQEVVGSLREKLHGLVVVLSVISDSRVMLDITGSAAREVLACGSTVDFHPTQFGVGHCISTRLAGVPVMLACCQSDEMFLLFADRSVAHYLLEWFGASSRLIRNDTQRYRY